MGSYLFVQLVINKTLVLYVKLHSASDIYISAEDQCQIISTL
jgi:hypothetical protein